MTARSKRSASMKRQKRRAAEWRRLSQSPEAAQDVDLHEIARMLVKSGAASPAILDRPLFTAPRRERAT